MSLIDVSVLDVSVVEVSVLDVSVVKVSVLEVSVLDVSVVEVSVLEVSVLEVSVLEVSVLVRGEAGGGRGGADTALKTKTPHDNVGKNRTVTIRHMRNNVCYFIVTIVLSPYQG